MKNQIKEGIKLLPYTTKLLTDSGTPKGGHLPSALSTLPESVYKILRGVR